jgi:subtilisin family serine protease
MRAWFVEIAGSKQYSLHHPVCGISLSRTLSIPFLEVILIMRKCALLTMTVLVLALFAGSAGAGTLHSGLEKYLEGLPADQTEKVIVRLSEQADISSLNRQLKLEGASLALRHKQVIEHLRDTAMDTQAPLVQYLEQRFLAGEVRNFRTFWIDNLVGVEATVQEIREIARRADVEMVFIDYRIELIAPVDNDLPKPMAGRGEQQTAAPRAVESGISAIKAPQAWALGFTGAGRLIANMDTGVDGNHEALSSRWRGLTQPAAECWFDPVTSTNFPFDSGSHGTHTMGTIAGHTAANEIGVAKDAQWIAAGVIDRVDIPTTMTDAVAAFQWFADPDGNPGTTDDVPDAVGNSWGISPIYHGSYITGPCDVTFWATMDNCEAAGCAVIFSAGNEGPTVASLRTPGDRADSPYNAFSVGAVDATYSGFPYPVSSFSSRGPGCNGQIKPEVVAPGTDVRSSVPGNGYSIYSGTSMASPHVTGSIAVLRQVNPDLDVDTIKEILLATAVDLGPAGEDNDYGMGIIDLEAAVIAASQGYGTVQGTVTDSSTAGPVPAHLVSLNNGASTNANPATGAYSFSLPGDETHTIEATYFGYATQQQAVYVPADGTVNLDFSLVATATGTIQGTVTDSGGAPVGSATVTVLNTPLAPVTTNGAGFYSLAAPGGASYDLQYNASGHQTVTISSVAVTEGGTTVQDVTLPDWYRILIWEPDPTPISGAAMQTALSALGWSSVTTGNLFAYSNPLTDYDAIFVLVGIYSSNYTFSSGSPEEAALTDYLDNGGNLYLEGGDVWCYDSYPATLRGYFNFINEGDGSADLSTAAGVAGTFTGGMSFSYSGENSWIDQLGATSPAYEIFTNPADGYGCGIAHDAGTYRAIGISYEFGGLDDGASPSTKVELMQAYIDFFGLAAVPVDTVQVGINCVPDSGTLPFSTHIYVTLDNLVGNARTVSASLDVTLAGGAFYSNFRGGFTNLAAYGNFSTDWVQNLPALGTLVGANTFALQGYDVTAAPYNQPPYAPSGDSDSASFTVTGLAP